MMYVYFVRRGGPDGLIKIGVTGQNIKGRLMTMRSEIRRAGGADEELTALLVAPGDRDDERRMHKRFGALREYGEWFRPDPELLSFIAAAQLEPSLITKIPEPPTTRGTPWRTTLAHRLEGLIRGSGISISSLETQTGVTSITAALRSLRGGAHVRMAAAERLMEFVDCELVLVPRALTAEVDRLIEGHPVRSSRPRKGTPRQPR